MENQILASAPADPMENQTLGEHLDEQLEIARKRAFSQSAKQKQKPNSSAF